MFRFTFKATSLRIVRIVGALAVSIAAKNEGTGPLLPVLQGMHLMARGLLGGVLLHQPRYFISEDQYVGTVVIPLSMGCVVLCIESSIADDVDIGSCCMENGRRDRHRAEGILN
jgi:hypothetical protein